MRQIWNGGNVIMANVWLVNNARTANNLARNEAVRRSRAEAAEERAKKAAEAAKKEMENARQEAVNRSKAEATAAKAAARAKREDSSRNNAARKAATKAKKAAENAEKAKKAAENAEKAKKLAANAIVKNVDNKLKVIKNGPGSKENKNKLGTKVYRKASLKLHPQRPGGSEESFKKLGSIYSNFQTKIGTKVRVEQELSNENRPR